MITNEEITIFNSIYDSETRSEKYYPTVIDSASVWSSISIDSTTANSPKLATTEYKLRIPYKAHTQGKKYIPKEKWDKLDVSELQNYWTIGTMDYIVLEELDNPEPIESETDIVKTYERTMIIRSYADNTVRGTFSTKHWKIGGNG